MKNSSPHNEPHLEKHSQHSHYPKLILMSILSFVAMYFLMYAMVDSKENVIHNINQFYMAGLMTASMVLIEIVTMNSMYHLRKVNVWIILVSVFLLGVFYFAIRQQTGVRDKQFLKSMIPHHAAAVLMVKDAELHDPEVQKLAQDIITAQQKEIIFMKEKIREMEKE